jgi:hypothetical protein
MTVLIPKDKPDLLIGAADLYNWSKVKVWAQSARDSGFTGEIALLTYRVDPDVVENAKQYGVDVYQIDHDPFGRPIDHNTRGRDTQAHQMRFFHAWQLLHTDNYWEKFRHVIITDVRDVYFQRNPSQWLRSKENYLSVFTGTSMIASSEGIRYKNEAWGADNMLNGFGPLVFEAAKEWTIYNVGVVAGVSHQMMGLFLTLYNMTHQRYIPSDQSAYNILVNETMSSNFVTTTHADDWACQCGTVADPTKSHLIDKLDDPRPKIQGGVLINEAGTPYTIIHQYDRNPTILRDIVEAKYGK